MKRSFIILLFFIICFCFHGMGKDINKSNTAKTNKNSSVNLSNQERLFLIHINPMLAYQDYVDNLILQKLEKCQKIVKSELLNKSFSYVLVKLGFINVFVKPCGNELNKCSGFWFYDYANKKLLLLESVSSIKLGKSELRFDNKYCERIEYYDLRDNTFEIVSVNGIEYEIVNSFVLIERHIPENLFPFIKKDYVFQRKLKIDDDFLKTGFFMEDITPLGYSLYKLELKTRKEFKNLVGLFEGNKKIEIVFHLPAEEESSLWLKQLREIYEKYDSLSFEKKEKLNKKLKNKILNSRGVSMELY